MKIYQVPELLVVIFGEEDVIRTSVIGDDGKKDIFDDSNSF